MVESISNTTVTTKPETKIVKAVKKHFDENIMYSKNGKKMVLLKSSKKDKGKEWELLRYKEFGAQDMTIHIASFGGMIIGVITILMQEQKDGTYKFWTDSGIPEFEGTIKCA